MGMEDILEEVRKGDTGYAAIFDLRRTPLMCSNMVRQFCENNACGKYGANWTCPPAVGPIDECISAVKKYSKVLVFRSDYKINEWYDYEKVEETIGRHQENVRRVRELIPKDAGDHLVLSGGGCVRCKECAYIRKEECRHPDTAIPPLEAYGIDIFHFAKKHGVVYGAPEGEMYYFGMILYD
ncbi:MAG: DUF2284 domain-containing protein [Methanomassiliicoccaceae archaeon]|nr:DUF2284 domain-containing protein [Methanomassiliicoccaceae archaeon]